MSPKGRPLFGRVFAMLLILVTSIGALSSTAAWAKPAAQLAEPQVSARAAILIEYPSGRILFQKNMHEKVAPASTTKILTALLALGYGNLDDRITVLHSDLV